MTNEEIAARIRKLFPDPKMGFQGRCGDAAIKINHVIFGDTAEYVGVANESKMDRGIEFSGHFAVMKDGIIWDADAKPKTWKDLEPFGAYDPDDREWYKKDRASRMRSGQLVDHGDSGIRSVVRAIYPVKVMAVRTIATKK